MTDSFEAIRPAAPAFAHRTHQATWLAVLLFAAATMPAGSASARSVPHPPIGLDQNHVSLRQPAFFVRDPSGRNRTKPGSTLPFAEHRAEATPDTVFRIVPVRPVEELRREALAATPPVEEGPFESSDLVDLAADVAGLRFDLRYASERNFMGMAFYREGRAFLQRRAARALEGALRDLEAQGFGLVVYDAYRPWYVTKMFWDATPDSMKQFVADPAKGSRHNRGAAIDVGLVDLETGEVVEMPSGYDEFTERAYADYEGGSEGARRNRRVLRETMERHGFTVYPYEWWHYDFADWRSYPILNLPFEEIR